MFAYIYYLFKCIIYIYYSFKCVYLYFIFLAAGAEVREIDGLKQLLREWALSGDEYIRANAIRAEASLAGVGKYTAQSHHSQGVKTGISPPLTRGEEGDKQNTT